MQQCYPGICRNQVTIQLLLYCSLPTVWKEKWVYKISKTIFNWTEYTGLCTAQSKKNAQFSVRHNITENCAYFVNCFSNIITGSRGGIINKHENLKHKISECNVNTCFKKQCLNLDIIPKSANMKIKNISPGSKYTQQKTQKLRIKGELKYLYTKIIAVFDGSMCQFS
jgi:hypothetical protein